MKKFIKRNTIILLISFFVSAFLTNIDIEHNAQGENCKVVAQLVSTPKKPERTFVSVGHKYIFYNSEKHKNFSRFFIQLENRNIHDANWKSNGDPCILTPLTIDWFLRLSFLLFSILFVLVNAVTLLILWSSKMQTTKENDNA